MNRDDAFDALREAEQGGPPVIVKVTGPGSLTDPATRSTRIARPDRPVIEADKLTVEYDVVGRQNAIAIVPFPHEDEGGLLIVGTTAELRGVVDTMSRLLDDLEDE